MTGSTSFIVSFSIFFSSSIDSSKVKIKSPCETLSPTLILTDLIFQQLQPSDHLVLLDDKGKDFTSSKFAEKLQAWMLSGKKRLVFVVGGAYGFSEQVYQRGNEKLSLSKMTFSHQMVRLFFVEQIYRGYTILNNEPYHHE